MRGVGRAPYFADLAVDGRPPRFAVEIAVGEVYLHCAKAFLRSELWQPDSWAERDHARLSAEVAAIEANLAEGYRTTLY